MHTHTHRWEGVRTLSARCSDEVEQSLRAKMPEREWDGKNTSDTSPRYRKLTELGPTNTNFSPMGPVTANSKTIRDYIRIMRTRYISVWQLAALAGGMQALLFFGSQMQAQDTVASLLFEQVHYWCRQRVSGPQSKPWMGPQPSAGWLRAAAAVGRYCH